MHEVKLTKAAGRIGQGIARVQVGEVLQAVSQGWATASGQKHLTTAEQVATLRLISHCLVSEAHNLEEEA